MSAQVAENLNVGDSLVSRRFLSSTRYLPVALDFLNTSDFATRINNANCTYAGILMVIQSRQGRAEEVHECNGIMTGEAEVIFAPNTVLQVLAILKGTEAENYILQFEAVKGERRDNNYMNVTVIVCRETTPKQSRSFENMDLYKYVTCKTAIEV